MDTKQQIGMLVITERATQTTYPVNKAKFEFLKYTDTTEIWFLVSAGPAVSNGENKDSREPRMSATLFKPDFDPADLSHVEFEIPDPDGRPAWPPVEAQFYYFSYPGKPADFRSGRIQFQKAVGNGYQVRWTALLDGYNGPTEPGSQIEIELNATFRLDKLGDVPVAVEDAHPKSEPRYYVVMFPLFLLLVLLGMNFPTLIHLFMGLFAAVLLGTMLATFLHDCKRTKITRLIENSMTRPDDAGQVGQDIAGEENQ